MWYAEFVRAKFQDCFCTNTFCHTHRTFRLPLCTFRSKLRTFPTVKSKTIGFLLNQTEKYTPVPFWIIPRVTSGKRATKQHYAAHSRAASMCHPTWCTCFHYKRFENCWKQFAEQLLVLPTVVLHHALVERGKDKTVKNAKTLKRFIGTMIANVPSCILRSRIVCINKTGFLFVVR